MAQGCSFQPVQDCSQSLSKAGKAGDDVVVSAKNDRALDETDRHIGKQLLEIAPRVDIDVRCQPVTPGTRQLVDQGVVSEMIPPAPVEPMGLKGIALVGAK